MEQVDLRTRYLGLDLPSPLVAAASPLTARVADLRRLEDAGAGAIVLPSLFAEQIEYEDLELRRLLEVGAPPPSETERYVCALDDYNTGTEMYLQLLAEAKDAVRIPVIASLNGCVDGPWVRYVKRAADAGADAIELNAYFVAADPELTAEDVERRYLALVSSVCATSPIPVAVKIGPYFSAVGNVARRMVAAGAQGLVLFNRFLQPDVDLATRRVVARASLSDSEDLLLPLRWIAILRGRVGASLAGSGGVHGADDALKLVLAGADVAQMASALLRHGPRHLERVLEGMRLWLEAHDVASLDEIRGSLSQAAWEDPSSYERAQYVLGLASFTNPYL